MNTGVDFIVNSILSEKLLEETGICKECGELCRGLMQKNIKMFYDYEILLEQIDSLKQTTKAACQCMKE